MLEFFILTNCTERGLYLKYKKVKRICRKNNEAQLFKYQSPRDIPAARNLCKNRNVSVPNHEWEALETAGRLSEFSEKGTLPPPLTVRAELPPCPKKNKDFLPQDASAVIYTDGSFFPDAKRRKKGRKHDLGGWAAVLVLRDYHDAVIMVSGRTAKHKPIDAYYMELLAVERALKRLKKYDISGKTVLFTDCQAVVTDYNAKLAGWAECGFRKPDGTYIKYHKLWARVWRRVQDIIEQLRVCWVKGHNNNSYNESCHITAQAEAVMRLDRQKQDAPIIQVDAPLGHAG